MCDRAFKSTVIAFLQKDRWTSWPWAGRGSRLQISLTCRPGSGSVTRIQLDPWQSFVLFVTVRKQWSCLYAGVWKHWCASLQHANSSRRLLLVIGSLLCVPLCIMFFLQLLFEANLIRDCCITLDAHWIQVLLLLAMLQWSLRANWFCTQAITLLF